MALDVVDTLQQLVRIPSVNPMGRSVSGAEFYEHALTDHLEGLFRRMEVPHHRQQVAPGRENILARVDGPTADDPRTPLIVFEAHQDTVPVDGMTIAPWEAAQREGRIYGRGACDIKGGMASMLAAFSRLVDERPPGMPSVVMACSVNEENGFTGARAMASSWQSGEDRLVPRIPDAVIVAEPTLLNVVVAHKGVVRWRCRSLGRAAHSSTPQLGENAIYRMAAVITALQQYAHRLEQESTPHPLLGTETLSVGVIAGGISVNTVPDECTIEIDRRLLPEETDHAARRLVIEYLEKELGGTSVVHEEPYLTSLGLSDARNEDVASQLAEVARRHQGPGALIGVPYGTDAPAFDRVGAPTVVFGPGSIEQAHTDDEWVAVEQLRRAADIYYAFATRPR